MLVYVHVPVCRRKCRYCSFHSEVLPSAGSGNKVRRYTDTLFMEIAQAGDRLGGQKVSSIFFGGGTPSLLPARTVGHILEKIHRAFKVDRKAEISMEANPESLKSSMIAREYLRAGVNRMSLGVQSLDDAMLQMLGRPHTVREAVAAYSAVRTAGFANVSMDLIWGLPGQSVRAWMQQIGEMLRLQPDHLSCYNLTLEEGTPMSADYDEGLFQLPPERDQATMFVNGAEILEEAGVMQYEVSNFARMGFQCRHNLGYWEGEEYIGFGPSATSTVASRRWTNPLSHAAWERQVQAGRLPEEIEDIDPVNRVLELIMLRLRTTRGMRVKAYKELTGRSFFEDNQKLIHALHKNGLIRIRDGYLRLTRNGMLVSNSILGAFFDSSREHLALAPARAEEALFGAEPGGVIAG